MSKMSPVIYLIAWSTGKIDVCLMCSMWFWSYKKANTSSLQIDVRMIVGNHPRDGTINAALPRIFFCRENSLVRLLLR